MPKSPGEPPRKRFSRSGHTRHRPAEPPSYDTNPPSAAPPAQQPGSGPPPSAEPTWPTTPLTPRSAMPPSGGQTWRPPPLAQPPPATQAPQPTRPYEIPPGLAADAWSSPQPANWPPPAQPGYQPAPPDPGQPTSQFDAPTYHQMYPPPSTAAATSATAPTVPGGAAAAAAPKTTVTRAVVSGSGRFAKAVTHKVISASQADGARESGLTALIWNQVLSYGADAMITVALAGTVFFGASAHAQRGNVLLYLLVTMAPFAVVAPVIGPALDRLQHGRRWAMSATGLGRAVLAMVMAAHPTDLLVLYPCALGSLVLSKAFSVIRAAAAPRLIPPGMTLVEANARLSIFGLGSALVGGGLVGAVIKVTGSYSAALWVTALAFVVCAMCSITLPKQVDSTNAAVRMRERERAPLAGDAKPARLGRLHSWARRGFEPQVITALQGESALRFLAGFLTIFLAFYIEATAHGFAAAGQLGAVGIAAGAGNFAGTGVGARLKLGRPEILIMICLAVAAVATLIAAIFFSVPMAIAAMFVSAVANSLAKVALDAVIQRDVLESLRSSAFGRSETFLQLAWVFGAAIACLLPGKQGTLGFWLSGVFVALLAIMVALRNRAMRHEAELRGARTTAGLPRYLPDQPHA